MKKIFMYLENRRSKLFLFGIMALFYFFAYFQRVAVPGTIFNRLQADFDISAASVTALSSMFMCVYASTQLFVGMLADRYGGMKVLISGGVLFCIGAFMFPYSGTLPELFISRIITGLGTSCLYLSIVKETDNMFGKKNFSVMLGLIFFIGYSGGLAGTLPFERVVSVFGWRDSLKVIALISVLILLAIILVPKHGSEKRKSKTPFTLKPLWIILKNKYAFPLFFSGSVNFAIYFTIQTVIGKKFLEDYVSMSSYAAASFTCLMMLFTMFTLLSSGIVSKLMGNRRRIFINTATSLSVLSSIMMICGLKFGFSGFFFLVCYIMFGVSSGFSTIFASTARELNPPECMALSLGLLNGLCYVLVAIISNIAGFMMDAFKDSVIRTAHSVIYPAEAYMAVFWMLLGLSVVSFLVSLMIRETNGNHIYPGMR